MECCVHNVIYYCFVHMLILIIILLSLLRKGSKIAFPTYSSFQIRSVNGSQLILIRRHHAHTLNKRGSKVSTFHQAKGQLSPKWTKWHEREFNKFICTVGENDASQTLKMDYQQQLNSLRGRGTVNFGAFLSRHIALKCSAITNWRLLWVCL